MKTRCLVLFLSLVPWATAQTTIYLENFSGSRVVDLNGQAPTIGPDGETWLAGTDSESWKADGYTEGESFQNAFLAFTPEAGKLYTLSFATGPSGGAGSWFSVGFTTSATVNGFFAEDLTPVGWMLVRDDRDGGSGGIGTFLGPSTDGGEEYSAPDGLLNASIVLDTTEEAWSVQWFLGATSLREAAFVGGNPEINYIAMGKFGDIAGNMSSLSLTETAVIPEPASVACMLGVMAGVVVVVVRRRRRVLAR